MEITLKEKSYEIIFGLKFNREIDIKYKVQGSGLSFGAGLDTLLPEMLAGSAVALSDLIYAGTAHMNKDRPSGHQIDAWLEEQEDLDAVFEEVTKAIEESNITKKKLAMWKKQLNIKE